MVGDRRGRLDRSREMVVDEGLLTLVTTKISVWIFSDQITYLPKQSQLQLSGESLSVTGQGYLDLVKASWILIDVIKRHPQLNLLNTSIRYEMELLAEVSRHSNDKSNGI